MNLVYTAIFDGYDKLHQPKVEDGWDYVCLSDVPFDGGAWEIVDGCMDGLDPCRASKYYKIMGWFEGYDNILWVDGSVEITGDLSEFLSELPEGDLVLPRHPDRDNLQSELRACCAMMKDDLKLMRAQVAGYNTEPYVFTQNTVILKRKKLDAMRIWWDEVKNKSKRDQLSFGWAMQQAEQEYSTYDWGIVEKYMIWHKNH